MATNLNDLKLDNKKVLRHGKSGRPRKKDSEKLTAKIIISLSEMEKEKLQQIARERYKVPVSMLIRNVLVEKDLI